MKSTYLILILSAAALLSACHKESEIPRTGPGYEYFPADPGHWVTYRVDSTSWDDFTDSVYYYSYQIKELIQSEFVDNEGRNTLRIERYIRASDTGSWTIKDIWYANLTASTAERVEENVRFIKLIFPVRAGAEWNGNAYNSLDAEDYTYEQAEVFYSTGLFSFDSSLTVKQRDFSSAISQQYSIEVYAKHVGMIYKKYIDIYDPPGNVKKGIDYSYTVIAWGD